MSMNPNTCRATLFATVLCLSVPTNVAQAGPLLDWLFGRRAAPAYPVGAPVPVGVNPYAAGYGGYAPYAVDPRYAANYGSNYAANYGSYYGPRLPVIGPSGAGYTPPTPTGITAATLPQASGSFQSLPQTLSYVPDFRTNAYRAPVTYYRPLMTTDPNTGAPVVAMAPCTSYEYQTGRVPTLGRNALSGSGLLPPVVPAPSAMETYTLPRGGIPLAGIAPNSPYATGYRGYTTYQPGLTDPRVNLAPNWTGMAPAISGYSNYPTTPLGSGYPGSAHSAYSGGSSGSFAAPTQTYVPGLTAPPAPTNGYIPETGYGANSGLPPASPGTTITPAPTWGQPTTPPDGYGSGVGSQDGEPGVYPPPANAPSSDPAANLQPRISFPMNSNSGNSAPGRTGRTPLTRPSSAPDVARNDLREIPSAALRGSQDYSSPQEYAADRPAGSSRLRQIVRQPVQSADAPQRVRSAYHPDYSRHHDSGSDMGNGSSRNSGPGESMLSPIPVPDDFEAQPRWTPPLLRDGDLTAMRPVSIESAQWAGHSKPIQWASFSAAEQLEFSHSVPSTLGRAAAPAQGSRPDLVPLSPAPSPAPAPAPNNRSRYDSSGWKASR